MLIAGIFYWLGLNQANWGNTIGNSFLMNWGKSFTSVAAIVFSSILAMLFVGMIVGVIKALLK